MVADRASERGITTVFLDRDGVINLKRPEGQYVTSWDEFEMLPGVPEALRLLKAAGARLILVTNQRGVARNLVAADELSVIHRRMHEQLGPDASFDAVYVCPHDEGCSCRKPEIGMFLSARSDFPDIEFGRAAVVGDSIADVRAGAAIGAKSFLVGDTERQSRAKADAAAEGTIIHGTARSLLELVQHELLPLLRRGGDVAPAALTRDGRHNREVPLPR